MIAGRALAGSRALRGALLGLALALLLYQVPFRGSVNIGDPWDAWFLDPAGAYPVQQGAGVDYRWTAGHATVRLPGLTSAGPLTVQIWAAGPAGAATRLAGTANGHPLPVATVTATEQPVGYTIPAAWLGITGDLVLQFDSATRQVAGEPRPLGFLLDRISVASGGPAPGLPDPRGLLVAALYGALAGALPRRAALALGGFLAGALAGGVVLARPWFALHGASLLVGGLALGAALLLAPRLPRPGRPALLVAAGLLAVYLLLLPGHFYVVDDDEKFRLAETLVTRASLRLDPPFAGRVYSKFGLGHSLAAAPLVAAALGVEALQGGAPLGELRKLFVLLLDPLCTAATAGLLCAFVTRLWAAPRRGAGVAILYGLGTLALPQALFAFSEPLITALLFGAVYGLYRAGGAPRPRGWLVGAGALLGYLVLTKAEFILAVPCLLVYYRARAGGWRPGAVLLFLAPVAAGTGLALAYNALRFGSPFVTGYTGEGFTTPLPVGLEGLLFSSGKSVFLYAPPLLLSVVAWPRFRREARPEAALAGALSAGMLVFYAAWWDWSGDWTWGPRYLLPALPLLALAWGALPLDRVPVRIGVAGVAVLGALAQLPGVLADWRLNFNRPATLAESDAREAALHFDPAQSPLLLGLRHLVLGPDVSAVLHLSNYGLPVALNFWLPHILGAVLFFVVVRLAVLAVRSSPRVPPATRIPSAGPAVPAAQAESHEQPGDPAAGDRPYRLSHSPCKPGSGSAGAATSRSGVPSVESLVLNPCAGRTMWYNGHHARSDRPIRGLSR